MSSNTRLRAYLYASVAAGAITLPATSAFAVCQGPGAPSNTDTKCVTAVTIPNPKPNTAPNPLQSFDISWVNPDRGEYYLADRSNASIDVLSTKGTPSFKRFVGAGEFTGVAVFALNNSTCNPPQSPQPPGPVCGTINN